MQLVGGQLLPKHTIPFSSAIKKQRDSTLPHLALVGRQLAGRALERGQNRMLPRLRSEGGNCIRWVSDVARLQTEGRAAQERAWPVHAPQTAGSTEEQKLTIRGQCSKGRQRGRVHSPCLTTITQRQSRQPPKSECPSETQLEPHCRAAQLNRPTTTAAASTITPITHLQAHRSAACFTASMAHSIRTQHPNESKDGRSIPSGPLRRCPASPPPWRTLSGRCGPGGTMWSRPCHTATGEVAVGRRERAGTSGGELGTDGGGRVKPAAAAGLAPGHIAGWPPCGRPAVML